MHSLVWRLLCRFWYWNLLGRGQQIPDLRICNMFQRKTKRILWYPMIWQHFRCNMKIFQPDPMIFHATSSHPFSKNPHSGKDPMITKIQRILWFPQEMFSPFIEAAVDSMKRYVSDDTALEAFGRMAERADFPVVTGWLGGGLLIQWLKIGCWISLQGMCPISQMIPETTERGTSSTQKWLGGDMGQFPG